MQWAVSVSALKDLLTVRPVVTTLQKRADFVRIANKGSKAAALGLVLQVGEAQTEDTRVGYTVTKKLGGAVIRNRIKRRLRAAAREIMPVCAAHKDYVIIGRKAALHRPFDGLIKDLKYTLHTTDSYQKQDNNECAT